MSDQELILRCDCGVEHVNIDLYFTKDAIDRRLADGPSPFSSDELEDGYLTIQQWAAGCPSWGDRLRLAWDALRGREHCLTSVILKPEDYRRIREFFGTEDR